MTLDCDARSLGVHLFVITNMSRSIIGADFLSHYDLLVDLQNSRLVDQIRSLSSPGRCVRCDTPSITTVASTILYHELLVQPGNNETGRMAECGAA